jgi:hypothetical protein
MKLKRALEYRRLLRTTQPRRYVNLFRTIYERRCRSIVEIGTWNGVHAEQMIRTAAARSDIGSVRYCGFDLFEDLTEEQLKLEFSKRPPRHQEVLQRLQRTGADIRLVRGNTRDTLPRSAELLRNSDFVFIDGGHSIETIAADWGAVRLAMGPNTTVIFDDYYPGAGPELEGLGCQSLIDHLDRSSYSVEVLEPTDAFEQPWGMLRVQMARVAQRRSL